MVIHTRPGLVVVDKELAALYGIGRVQLATLLRQGGQLFGADLTLRDGLRVQLLRSEFKPLLAAVTHRITSLFTNR